MKIHAPQEYVFKHIKNLKLLNDWNPLARTEKNYQSEIKGNDGQIGSTLIWRSNRLKRGQATLVEIIDNDAARFDFKMSPLIDGKARAQFYLLEDAGITHVECFLFGRYTLYTRFITLFVDVENNVGKQCEIGLRRLRELCEKNR